MIAFLGRPRAVTVGEGHAPVVAVLETEPLEKRPFAPMAVPKGQESWTPAVLTC
jgi:hypothetical protein